MPRALPGSHPQPRAMAEGAAVTDAAVSGLRKGEQVVNTAPHVCRV